MRIGRRNRLKPRRHRVPRIVVLCSWAVVAWLTACQTAPTRIPTDFDRLQGHWQGRGPGGACTVVIEGNVLTYTQPHTDPSEPQFRYKTTFTLPKATGPKQMHATIVENSFPDQPHVGTVVVSIYEVDMETLRLGVVESHVELPEEPVVGDWEWVRDLYELERVRTPAD